MTSTLQASYNEVALSNSRLRTEIAQLELEVAAWRQANDLKAKEIERLHNDYSILKTDYDSRGGEMDSMREWCWQKEQLNIDSVADIKRLKIENEKMLCQLEKIADFTVHPYSAAKAVLKELGRWTEPKP